MLRRPRQVDTGLSESVAVPNDPGLDARRPMLVLGLVVVVLTAVAGLPGRPQPAGQLDGDGRAALHDRLLTDLPMIREAILLYQAQHDGHVLGQDTWEQFVDQLCSRTDPVGAPGVDFGPYLDPACLLGSGRVVEVMPETAHGGEDWIWCPRTSSVRVNRPGVGPTGAPWFHY